MKDYKWLKAIGYVLAMWLLAYVVGYGTGYLLGSSSSPIKEILVDIRAIDIDAVIQSIVPYLFIVATIFCSIGFVGYLYFNNLLKKDGYSNEENSVYDKSEKKINVIMSFSAIGTIINFTSFAFASGLLIDSNDEGLLEVFILTIFIFNGGLEVMNQVLNISLIKRIRPEIDPNPLNKKFHQEYFNKLDEREQFQVGKSCFRTVSGMTVAHLIVVMLCCPIVLLFEVTPLICLPVALVWAIQTIMNVYYTNKEL